MRGIARRVLLGSVLAAGVSAGVRPGASADPGARPGAASPAEGSTAAWIAQLGSADYRVRERAALELSRQGEAVLPQLRGALAATTDAEVARRLDDLIRKLEYDRLTRPRRVTLHVKDKPLNAILEEISRQTGYVFAAGTIRPDITYSYDWENVPFWQAVDAVTNAAGVTIYPEYDDVGTLRVYEQDVYNPYVAYSGPFRFIATNINSNRNIQLSGLSRRFGPPVQPEYMHFNFQIQSEPKAPILATTFTELTAAEDDTGQSLLPTNDPNYQKRVSYYNGGYRGYNVHASLNLLRASRQASTARVIKGLIGVQLLTGTRPEITVPNPLAVKNAKFLGRTVEVEIDSLVENNTQYTLTATVKRLGPVPQEMDFTWSQSVWQKFELVDEKGVKLHNYGANNQNNQPNVVQLTLIFSRDERPGRKPGKPVQLVYNEWLTTLVESAFEFKNIPLP